MTTPDFALNSVLNAHAERVIVEVDPAMVRSVARASQRVDDVSPQPGDTAALVEEETKDPGPGMANKI